MKPNMNMKQMVVVVAIGLSMLCWRTASAATTYTTEIDGSTWSYTLSVSSDKTTTNATITAVTPADGALVVPAEVDGYSVVSIGNNVGKSDNTIKSVFVPDSVTSIGSGAFTWCTSLGEVVLGDGVTTIYGHSNANTDTDSSNSYEQYGAFAGCTALTNIVFGSSLRTISHQCFARCTALPSLTLPDTVTTLGAQCFYGATSLREVSIGTGLSSMGAWAFGKCTALKDVVFRPCDTPKLAIAESAFRACSKLESVTFSEAVTSFGGYAFNSCSALKRVVIPDSVTGISGGAFTWCTSLGEVVLGDGVTTIYGHNNANTDTDSSNSYEQYGAFAGCTALTNIVFGSSLRTIGNQSFTRCAVSRLVFPDTVTSIGVQCFYGSSLLGSVTFGNRIASIGAYAFGNCPCLRYLNFRGDPPTTVGNNAFNKVKSAAIIYRADDNDEWSETWRGYAVKPASEITADADAPYDLVFHQPEGWSTSFFLTAESNSYAVCTRFLAGDPIYAQYAYKDAWGDVDITVSYSNVLYVSGTDEVSCSWLHDSGLKVGHWLAGDWCLRSSLQNLPPGEYTATLVLNEPRMIRETNYANNSNSVTFVVVPSTLISFMSEDNIVATDYFEKGGSYGTLPVAPLRPYYNFIGWFTDADGGNVVTETSKVPDSPATLYAHWEIRPTQTNYVSGTVSASATWRTGDLYVVRDDLTISNGATLTVEPGVIVKFAMGKSLIVNRGGALSAIGTRAQPIVFTSVKDDANGGDTNGDGALSTPQPGDWHQICNYGTANLEHAKLLYCSAGNNQGALYPCGGTMTFKNSIVAHCEYDCMRGAGGTFIAENSIFTDASMGVAPQSGKSTFVNCVFYSLTTAVRWGNGIFANCIFSDIAQDIIDTKFYSSTLASKFSHCCFWNPEGTGDHAAAKVGKDGNFYADPLLVNPANGNFRIMANSPCVDAGDGTVAPEKDYYGSPRMNVDAVRPTGTLAANGAVPDIGIFEVPGDGNIPSADLTVTAVTAPASLTVGEKVEVSWTVQNVGEETAAGMWRDEIEIVAANGQTFSMGTATSQAEIKPGATANFKRTLTVPSAPEGAVQVRVTANKYQDLFEAMKSENNVGSAAATLAVPTLAVPTDGTATTVTLGGDSDTGFALDGGSALATQGGVLVIRGAGELDAWLGNGSIAAKDNAIRTAVKITGDTWLLQIPKGSEPRVTVRNDGEGEVAAQLSLEVGGFFLLDTGKKSAANSGVVSVPFFGNGFGDSLVCWLECGGKRVEAGDLKVESGVSALATFDVTGCEAGDWTLYVKNGTDEAFAVLLTLTQSQIGAKWWCKVNVLESMRQGRVYVGSIEYGNSGDAAMDAPYLILKPNANTLVRLSESDAWTDTVELMGVSDTYPASVLKAGEKRKVDFFYKPSGRLVYIDCDYTLSDANAFPWDTNSQYMRPSWATDEMWRLALATLKSNVGATWDDFLQRMRDNADHLMKLGYRTERLDRLWQMVINDALGSDHAVQTLARGTDLARSGRGLGLSFSRTYGAAMFKRFKKGIFGYGWTDNYSTYAELVDSTTLAFHLPSGATYQFHKVNGKWTPEDARDKTILAETTSAYTLTYKSGTVQTVAKSNMRTSSIRDNQGNELSFTYSGTQLQKVQHSDGQSLTFSYAGGKVASVSDDQGRTVTYGYTGDLLTSVTAFNGLVTRYVYHAADSTPLSRALTQIVYPDGTTKDYTYDDYGRVATASVNGNQFTTEIVRGVCGSYSVIAPNGGVTEVTVGASGETLKTVNALGQIVQQKYTADTQLESVIAPSGKRNKITYNTDGSPVASLSASGATTSFSYEPDFDNLASVTDAKGHAISYGYDDKGRGNSISYVDGSMSSLEYNEKGDVAKAMNRRGETIEYEYDAEGNLTKKTWPNGRTFTLAYDAKGNVTNAADSVTGAVTMEYDAKERLTRIVYPKGRGFTYAYDEFGRMTERTMLVGRDDPIAPSAAATQRYTYDSLGRLAIVTDGDGNPYLTNAYDPTTGWLITQTYGNGTVVSNAYDILGRTVGIYHGRASSPSEPPLAFFEYAYDADGKCISQTTAEGTESYTYDADGQLTAVTYPDGTSETFTYDADGNRITSGRAASPLAAATTVTYTVNALNQYTQIDDTTLEYDLDGNMTRKGDAHYYYDTLNRLIAVTNEAENIRWSCEYDVFGNRVSVTDNGTTAERLFVQGSLPSVAAEFNGDTLSKSHILVGAVRLATHNSPTPNSPTLYYHADLLGSARLLTDGTGATKGTRSFKAFGETRTSTGEATDAGYVGTFGVETDPNGLLFMRNRYYNAGMGRFIQMDPIGIASGSVNLYKYVSNNPLTYIDIIGLSDEQLVDDFVSHIKTCSKLGSIRDFLKDNYGLTDVIFGATVGGDGKPLPGAGQFDPNTRIAYFKFSEQDVADCTDIYAVNRLGNVLHEAVAHSTDPSDNPCSNEIRAYRMQFDFYRKMGFPDLAEQYGDPVQFIKDRPEIYGAEYQCPWHAR